MEIVTNVELCFKTQYAELPDINLKINYVQEKYVGHVSAKKNVYLNWIKKMKYNIKNNTVKDTYLLLFCVYYF